EAAAFQASRQIGDLAVYERRREPRGYLRLQTGAREVPRNAARRKRRDSRPPRLSGAADEKPVPLQTTRAIRRVGLRAIPAPREQRGRSGVHPFLPGQVE